MNIQVDEAWDGAEALTMVQSQTYDGVLMDIQMPVMDGLEATRRIRALAEQPDGKHFADLPIIAMTALAMAHDAENCRAAGMNDHVVKPIEAKRLFECLSRWLPPALTQPITPHGITSEQTTPSAKIAPELLRLKHIQASEGIRRIGGKEAAYRKQLKRFREHYANAVDTLQTYLQAGHLIAAENYCHSLKGVSGNIGAKTLFEHVAYIDKRLKQQRNLEDEDIARFSRLLQDVMNEIDSLSLGASLTMTKGEGLSNSELCTHVNTLMTVLETDLGAAEMLMATLRQGTAGTRWEADINAIAEQIDAFDIDKALASLTALQSKLQHHSSTT